jgi:hypothetical protein
MGPRVDARVEAALHHHRIALAIKASFGSTRVSDVVDTEEIYDARK